MKKAILSSLLMFLFSFMSILTARETGRLEKVYESINAARFFDVQNRWLPYPDYDDREGWDRFVGNHKDFIIRTAERYLAFQWQTIPATAYLAYERTGERKIMETPFDINRNALSALMLGELAEGKGRFTDDIINGLWNMCQMPSWVLSAHQPRQQSGRSLPDIRYQLIDLVSGGVGLQVAMAWHFFHDTFEKIDPSINYLLEHSVRERILDPYLDSSKDKSNWWLGFRLNPGAVVNNWNPWCNSNVIMCFLLMEKDPERLAQAVLKSVRSVDKFMDYVKEDGACEEGPAYWSHAAGKLYDYLQIMYDASGGRFSIFDNPMVKDMGEYISRSYVGDGWVVNFADASARLTFSTSLIYNYGKAVDSREMMDFALMNQADVSSNGFRQLNPTIWHDIYRTLESLRTVGEINAAVDSLNTVCTDTDSFNTCVRSLSKALPSFVWYPQTEFCYMRNNKGWFFASKGGHNNESHNHNDIGTFTLYIDNIPVFADAGVGTYTKKTFGRDRYTIWSMRSEWHNLPMINGTGQHNGKEYRSAAVSVKPNYAGGKFYLDISPAYTDSSSCASWVRSYDLDDSQLTVTDTYRLNARNLPDVENFLVQGNVYLPGDISPVGGEVLRNGEVVVENKGVCVKMTYPKNMTPSVQIQTLDDPRLTGVWGTSLRRISFMSAPDSPLKGKYQFRIIRL